MAKATTKFNWKCAYCNKRHTASWKINFEMGRRYTCVGICRQCGKENELIFDLSVRRNFKPIRR